jgi:hypothetical protein
MGPTTSFRGQVTFSSVVTHPGTIFMTPDVSAHPVSLPIAQAAAVVKPAAKKMAGNLGDTDKAIAALQALKRFEG